MRLRWTRRAAADLNRIAARIAADNPLAAGEFALAVRARAERLKQFSLLGRPGALDDTRELIVHRNYILTYRLRDDEVQMLQLWHVARNLPLASTPRE
jgi:toxin ParE1/3/4